MTLQDLSALAATLKPILECLAFIAGFLAIVKWLRERRDRATDVLLKLEEEFDRKCAAGRPYVEEPARYKQLIAAMAVAGRRSDRVSGSELAEHLELVKTIDDLLRFYVVLAGVRQAKQIPDASLSTSYRFWLAHYYRRDRAELRKYINENYPTLRAWLLRDARAWTRFRERPLSRWWRSFFRPDDFWRADSIVRDPAKLFDAS